MLWSNSGTSFCNRSNPEVVYKHSIKGENNNSYLSGPTLSATGPLFTLTYHLFLDCFCHFFDVRFSGNWWTAICISFARSRGWANARVQWQPWWCWCCAVLHLEQPKSLLKTIYCMYIKWQSNWPITLLQVVIILLNRHLQL